ncbi:MAG: hypothetical protein AAFO04_19355 [Cyanobacteria bacterium J06592_8]
MSKAKKSNYQLLAKYLPYIGLFLGSVSFFALVSVLPVFNQMNLFRAVFLLSILGFVLMVIKSELNGSIETILTDLGILGLISIVAGWLVYMV